MGSLIIPFEVASQNMWRQNSGIEIVTDRPFYSFRTEWNIHSSASNEYYAITIVDNYNAAKIKFEEFYEYSLWRCFNELNSIRITGSATVLDRSGECYQSPKNGMTNIANVSQAAFVAENKVHVLSAATTLIESISGNSNKLNITEKIKAIDNPKISNAISVFLNSKFASDIISAYLLVHSALDIVAKEKGFTSKVRISDLINSLNDSTLDLVTVPEVKRLTDIRNDIAHEGISPNAVDLLKISFLTERVIRLVAYNSSEPFWSKGGNPFSHP